MSAGDVRLRRIRVATARALLLGTLGRPGNWHPEFPADGTLTAARMLLDTYAALGQDPGRSPWWFFGIVADGVVVGDAGFHGPPPADGPAEVEIGYQVVPSMRRRGIATAGCGQLRALAWAAGARSLLADIDPANRASREVLLRNGFRSDDHGSFRIDRPV